MIFIIFFFFCSLSINLFFGFFFFLCIPFHGFTWLFCAFFFTDSLYQLFDKYNLQRKRSPQRKDSVLRVLPENLYCWFCQRTLPVQPENLYCPFCQRICTAGFIYLPEVFQRGLADQNHSISSSRMHKKLEFMSG